MCRLRRDDAQTGDGGVKHIAPFAYCLLAPPVAHILILACVGIGTFVLALVVFGLTR